MSDMDKWELDDYLEDIISENAEMAALVDMENENINIFE